MARLSTAGKAILAQAGIPQSFHGRGHDGQLRQQRALAWVKHFALYSLAK